MVLLEYPIFGVDFIEWTLLFHVAFGSLALGIGVVPMLTTKGSRAHNITGRIYFWAMIGVVITVIPVMIAVEHLFLGSLAVFSFYMCFTGYRITKLKDGSTSSFIDKAVTILTAIAAVGMLYLSYLALSKGGSATLVGILLTVFGSICLAMTLSDLRRLFSMKEWGKMEWIYSHLGRMIGSYIAAATAFTVQNSPLQPDIANWLAPTVFGTIAIVLTTRYYKKKFRS